MKKITTLLTLLVLVAVYANAQTPIVFSTIAAARNPFSGTPADSGKIVQVTGIVYGPNSYPTHNGQAFWLNDGTAGIKIYSKHVYGDYQTVTTGDSVTVVGYLSAYYSSAEIDLSDTSSLDTIIYNGAAVADTPIVITVAGFSTQTYGTLVQVNNVNMTAATGWTITPGKHYFTAKTGGLYIYVDSFTNAAMFNAPQPQGIYNVRGIGDDYSPTKFNLDPRGLTDFIPVTTGIDNIQNLLSAIIYPNPASTQLMVTLGNDKDETLTAKMFDVTGQMVLSETREVVNGENNLQFNTANLTNGMYILELRTAEKSLNTKIIVAK